MEVEKQYIKETGIFPIMHAVAIRKDLGNQNPWIAMNLLNAFEEAKRRSIDRALFVGSCFPIPWGYELARQAQELLGEDYWLLRHRKQPKDSLMLSCNTPTNKASATEGLR